MIGLFTLGKRNKENSIKKSCFPQIHIPFLCKSKSLQSLMHFLLVSDSALAPHLHLLKDFTCLNWYCYRGRKPLCSHLMCS